MGYMMIQKNQ